MSIDEPTSIGTVVRDINGHLWVRCYPDAENHAWRSVSGSWLRWSEIPRPTVVHEGYRPPTPEPMYHGARIIDADDLRLVRKWSDAVDEDPYGEPWTSARGISYAWSELTQPVTVIDDGSDW